MAAVNAGSAMVKAYLDGTALTRGLNQAQAKLRAFGQSIAAVGQRMFLLGAIGIAAGVMAARSFAQYGDAAAKMARRTGFAVEAILELSWAAERSGADMATLEKGFRRMEATVLDAEQGLATAKLTFKMLGLSVEKLIGLKPEERFTIIAARLNEIPDAGRRAAVAMEMFGRAGTMLLPMLSTMSALRAEARQLGFVMSAETAAAAEELTDAMSRLKRTFQMMLVQIGAALSPKLLELLGAMMRTAVSAARWISQNKELIVTLGKWALAITAAGAALLGLAMGIKIAAFALVPLQLAISAIGAVLSVVPALLGAMISGFTMLATPIGAITAGLLIMVAALLYTTNYGGKLIKWFGDTFAWLGGVFGRLKSDALATFQGIMDAMIAGDLGLAAEILWLGVKMVFLEFKAWVTEWWVAVKEVFITSLGETGHIMLKGLANTWGGVKEILAMTDGFLQKLFIAPFRTAAKLVYDAISNLTQSMVWLFGKIPGFGEFGREMLRDIEDTRKAVHALIDSTITDEQKKRVAAVDEETIARIAGIEAEYEKRREALSKLYAMSDADRKAGWAKEVADAQTAADAAREKWDVARALAAKLRKEEERPPPPGAPPKPSEPLMPLADVVAKMEARVTFAGARVAGLGLGTTAQDRTAKASEDTARNTKDIKDQIEELQGEFV